MAVSKAVTWVEIAAISALTVATSRLKGVARAEAAERTTKKALNRIVKDGMGMLNLLPVVADIYTQRRLLHERDFPAFLRLF